ncbi:MAG: hypothetical protein AB7E84_21225 [Xanthobacteraceae bacterium]
MDDRDLAEVERMALRREAELRTHSIADGFGKPSAMPGNQTVGEHTH